MPDPDAVAALRAEIERQRREGSPFADQSVLLRELADTIALVESVVAHDVRMWSDAGGTSG